MKRKTAFIRPVSHSDSRAPRRFAVASAALDRPCSSAASLGGWVGGAAPPGGAPRGAAPPPGRTERGRVWENRSSTAGRVFFSPQILPFFRILCGRCVDRDVRAFLGTEKNEPNAKLESRHLGKKIQKRKKCRSCISRPLSRNEREPLPKVVAKLCHRNN